MADQASSHDSADPDAPSCPDCGQHLYRSGGIDYTELVADRTEGFTGRGWVFQAIDAWLADGRGPRVFFLGGGPGTGKSAVAARLVQMSEGAVPANGYRQLGAGFLGFYRFCQAGYGDTLDPLHLTTALFLRLKERYPAFLSAFLQTLPPDPAAHIEQHVGTVRDHATVIGVMHSVGRLEKLEISGLPAGVAFNRLIAAPLKKLDASLDGPLVILLDALDEALTQSGETLVDLLRDATDDPRDLPPNVRFLVTGRPDGRVRHALGEPALDLLAGAPPDADDVRTYANSRLDRFPDPRRSQLADRIAQAAEGNFLYARYVIDDLPPLVRETDDDDLPLPKGLTGVYRRFLERELAENLDTWDDDYSPLLGVLAVAQNPGFTRAQLDGITGLPGNKLRKVLRKASQYLAGAHPDGPFRIYHQSFRDFLLQDPDYRIDPRIADRQVSGFFWQVLYAGGQAATAGESQGGAYAVSHLPLHLAGAGDEARLRELLLDYRWLSARVAGGETAAAAADYERAPDDPELRLVGGALRLAAHVLAGDRGQLAGQLLGRLLDRPEPGIQALLAQAAASVAGPWLRPLTRSLAAPGGPRLRTLAGHTGGVNSVAGLLDGRRAVSGSLDHNLILWNLDTGERLRTFEGHTGSVESVAVLPGGRRAVSRSWDYTLILWDLDTGEQLRTLEGHTSYVTAVAVLPGGRRAVSGSYDKALILWDLDTGKRLAAFVGDAPFTASAVTPDGRTIVAGDEGGRVHFLRLEGLV